METPKDELANLITERLHDPAKFVERGPHPERKDREEPLKLWQTRAIMTAFDEVVKKEWDGKITIMARTPFRDPSPELDGE